MAAAGGAGGGWGALLAGWTGVLVTLLVVQGAGAGGTTPNLQQIFIGRCWDYQAVVNPGAFDTGAKNCSRLYADFLWAFSGRSPCDVPIDRYINYTKAAAHPIESDKSMFWIGVYHLVHRYSETGRRFTTISDTLTGYLVNNLVWCGKDGGELDTEECPAYGTCKNETSISFWRSTSIQYAKLAKGTAYVMLNGTKGKDAFTENSVFANYELPHIDPSRVRKIHAYIIHDIGKPPRESCNDSNSSLTKLRRLVIQRGFEYECTDDPISVRLLQCVDQTSHPECQTVSRTAGLVSSAPHQWRALTFPSLTVLLIAFMTKCL